MMRTGFIVAALALLVVLSACATETDNATNATNTTEQAQGPQGMPALNGTGPREPTDKEYVTKDIEQCKVIRYACPQGKKPFSDAEGCGCETDPTKDPDNLSGTPTGAADPTKHYAIRDAEQCKGALFKCSGNQTAFFDDAGCGCQDLPGNGTGTVTVKFQPKQCQELPWQAWYAEGNIKFVKTPTDAELIVPFYGEQGIALRRVQKADSGMMTCQACDVCATSHYFTAEVDASAAQQMIAQGWTR